MVLLLFHMKQFHRPSVIAALGFAVALIPLALVVAAEPTGLVPCTGLNCQACSVVSLIQNVIRFVMTAAIPIAAILFAYAGILYFTSGGSTGRIEKAHSIFGKVALGFILTISGWLIVETILRAVLAPTYFQNWNTITCVDNKFRPTEKKISELLGMLNRSHPVYINGVQQGNVTCQQGSTYNAAAQNCEARYDNGFGGQTCEITAPRAINTPSQVGRGDCSPAALTDDWGNNAAAMSCITQAESSCIADRPSTTDRSKVDGTVFSSGLYQINISANYMQCDGFNEGQRVDCPTAAFNGRNYNATVKDQDVYQQCITMANNVQCATQNAQRIYQQQGFRAWSTAAGCGL